MWYACGVAITFFAEGDSVELPVELGAGIRIDSVPEWVKTDEALRLLSWTEREAIRDAQIAFAADYDAEALGSPDSDWKGKQPRGIQSVVDEKFALAALALWLVKPTRLSCGPALHFSRAGDPESLRTASITKNLDNRRRARCHFRRPMTSRRREWSLRQSCLSSSRNPLDSGTDADARAD
jgi:hypothetical protein